jgi:hypothetical protein
MRITQGKHGNAQQRQGRATSADFSPSAVTTNNRQPEQVESVNDQDAAGPGVPNPELSLARVRSSESELQGEKPGRDEK